MFKSITKTWNPFVGCDFECYNGGCWARRLALEKLNHLPRYSDGFKPKFIEKELLKRFKPDEFVAVSLMGDISFATREEILRILNRVSQFPQTYFLFQSKNPSIFRNNEWPNWPNIYYGTTIETNRGYLMSKAPLQGIRYEAMVSLNHTHKFISIEPIMNFDLSILLEWMRQINPEIIEVGADNYSNHLPEPPWWKVITLLAKLRDFCPKVVEKEGLERLRR